MSLLKFDHINFQDKEKFILKDICISINNGDFLSIVGPSGSGKSTFLKLCCNLISPSSGKILYNNKNVLTFSPTELRKNIAYCFQAPCLFGNTVMDNLSFPFNIRNVPIDMNRINYLFSLFQMNKSFINKDILKLSGGEKQRISLIRTLLFKPDILLLDEITSALDVTNTLIVENVINKLNTDGITILWVTHNFEQSRKYANKLLTINNGLIQSLEVLK